LDRFLEQLKTFHEALDPVRRKVLYGAVSLSLVAMMLVAWFATADVYVTVLDNARRDRVQATAAQLEELTIPYRVTGGGTGLEVPEQFQGRAFRLAQDAATAPAAEEMPEAQGFMTPRDQEQRYKFLLQQRVAQNIAALRGVNRARVELVLADDSSFFAEETPARAAVVLELEGGVTFGNEQVRGVVALLRNSVDGLDAEQISIVDDSGALLFEGQRGGAGGGLDSALMSRKRALESDLEGKVHDHLVRRLGSSMDFTVTALVELTSEASTVQIREVDPDSAVTISSQMTEEKTSQTRTGGVPGTEAYAEGGAEQKNNAGSSERLNEKVNYDVSQTTKTITEAPGAVKRQAVSVQVDQARLVEILGAPESAEAGEEAAEGEAAEVDPAWLAEQSKAVEESIRAAVFFDDERGDVLHVTITPFSPLQLEAAPSGFSLSEATPYARYAVAALALILLFTTVLKPLVARVAEVKTPEDVEREAEEAAEEAASADPDDDLAARLRDLVENYEAVDADDLNRLVEREDEAAAQVIRLWSRNT